MAKDKSEAALRALEMLAEDPAFKGVTPSHLADMGEHARTRHFAPGEELMREGATSDCLHVVVQGVVRVTADDPQPRVLAELGRGQIVGEMGVLTGDPRSATVTAVGEVETLELTADELRQIFSEDHMVLLGFIMVMQDRLHSPGA